MCLRNNGQRTAQNKPINSKTKRELAFDVNAEMVIFSSRESPLQGSQSTFILLYSGKSKPFSGLPYFASLAISEMGITLLYFTGGSEKFLLDFTR